MLDQLKKFLDDAKALRRDLKALSSEQVARMSLRARAEDLGSRWCNDLAPEISRTFSFEKAVIERYSSAAARLIRLSAPNNLRKSYLEVLGSVIRPFRNEIILPIQQGTVAGSPSSLFDTFFQQLATPDESEYLKEAISCASQRFYRAAVVLGWCAAIDRIHRKIEALGFPKFTVTSAQMASQTKGRFKKFNQPQNVANLSELREVFDTAILWVIEGMGLIDSNQHTRLRSCFDMRCHGAHPGDAPITEFNLLSFFSDLDEIVFKNPSFQQ